MRVYVWQGASGAWLAQAPDLEAGAKAETRGEALRELRTTIARGLRTLFDTDIEIIDGPPKEHE